MDYDACSFIMVAHNGKVLLKLASQPEWAVGFRRTGEPLLGKAYDKRRKGRGNMKEPECFVFKLTMNARVAAAQTFRQQTGELNESDKKQFRGVAFVPRRTVTVAAQ